MLHDPLSPLIPVVKGRRYNTLACLRQHQIGFVREFVDLLSGNVFSDFPKQVYRATPGAA